MVTTLALIVLVFTVYLLESSFACNGYQLKVNHIQNCNPNSIIKLENLNLILNDKCEIIPSGCVIATKRFETAKIHYVARKPPLPTLQGDVDACATAENNNNADANQVLDMFQLPKTCPVNKSKVCADATKKISIEKYKNRLSLLAGNLTAKMDITHNNGVSCIDINLTLQRPRRG